jgi:large subunit ribosomal protein L25
MAQSIELKATARAKVGKGAAKHVRLTGLVPGVVYGDKRPAQAINIPYTEIWKHFKGGRFLSTVFQLDVEGASQQVIPRDVQVDPVKDFVIHVDFQRISKNATVRVGIPVVFLNHEKSPGLKRGGVLNIVRHEIELYCPADAIPDHLEVNLEGLEIGASVHISAVTLPPNTRPTITDRDFTVATIAGAKAEEVEVKPEAVVAEGEAAAGAEGAAAAEGAAKGAAPAKDEKKK